MKISFAMPSPEEVKSIDGYRKHLEKIAELGYAGVEPLIGNPGATNWNGFPKILEQCNLELSGLRTGFAYTSEGLNFSDPDENVRRKAIERLIDIIKFATAFGKPNILIGLMQGRIKEMDELSTPSMRTRRGVACPHPSDHKGRPSAKRDFLIEVKDRIVDCLRNCASAAEKCGIVLVLEPVNRYELSYNNTVGEVIQMIQKVGLEQIKILIDTFHMNIEEKSVVESIIKAKDYIGHVHFADSNRLAPGKGHMDFQEIMRALKEIRYNGYITIECELNPDFETSASDAINYLKPLM